MKQPVFVGSKVKIVSGKYAGKEGTLMLNDMLGFSPTRYHVVTKKRSFLKIFHFQTGVDVALDQLAPA